MKIRQANKMLRQPRKHSYKQLCRAYERMVKRGDNAYKRFLKRIK
jgi:hypothetical protein